MNTLRPLCFSCCNSAPLIGKYAASLLAATLASASCYFCPEMSAHDPQDYVTVSGGETVRVMRNAEQENAQLEFLAGLGFQPVITRGRPGF